MPILEIRDVHKWYGDFHVLNGISETVEKGEVVFYLRTFRFRQKHLYPLFEQIGSYSARFHFA